MLMINLVNTSLYSFNKTYDYQSVCDPEKDSKAAAGPRSVYVVRRFTFGTLKWSSFEVRALDFLAVFFLFLSFSLPLPTCSVLAGGHQVLPGKCSFCSLFIHACFRVGGLFFLFYCNVFVWKWATGEKCSYTTVQVCL